MNWERIAPAAFHLLCLANWICVFAAAWQGRWFWAWETIDEGHPETIYYVGLFALIYKTRLWYPELRFWQRWS